MAVVLQTLNTQKVSHKVNSQVQREEVLNVNVLSWQLDTLSVVVMETWRDTDKHVIHCVPSQLPDWQPLHRLRGLPRICGGLTATAEMAGWTRSLQI